ncbi:serine/threonine-protein kinase [Nocardiopsis alkaliphila]|uniref:serine/threonine-protein kinase n=1 Tax=Nocardiopsis alkaliphila TaxID=225762 RepID=UPI0003494838|nr:serine/threonine-protein kinase [Nocardiopsis alkaliphila]
MRPPDTVIPPPGVLPCTSEDPPRLGPYRIIGRLGAGGMGVVYAAVDRADRPLAVKLVRAEYAADPDFRERFAREVRMVRRVRGTCLPTFLNADVTARRPWLATEYVPGPTLRTYVTENGPLTGEALIAFAAGLAEALSSIHAADVVHRDLKPGNVLLSPNGPKVLDFGIARALEETALTRTGGLFGTPGWVSPERYGGAAPDAASDMFAWGGLVLLAATARSPFGRGDAAELARRALEEEPDLTGVPDFLLPWVRGALAKDPAARPTAAQILAGLAPAPPEGDTTQVLTRMLGRDWQVGAIQDTSVWGQVAPRRARRMPRFAAAAAAVVVTASLGWFAGNQLSPSPDPPDVTGEQPSEAAEPQALSGITHGGPNLVEGVSEEVREDLTGVSVRAPSANILDVATTTDTPVPPGTNEYSRFLDGMEDEIHIVMLGTERVTEGLRIHGRVDLLREEGDFVLHSNDFTVARMRCFQAGSNPLCADLDSGADFINSRGDTFDTYPLADEEVLAILTSEQPSQEFSLTVLDPPSVSELYYTLTADDLWGSDRRVNRSGPGRDPFEESLCIDAEAPAWAEYTKYTSGGYHCAEPDMSLPESYNR